ncbi:MULTISPECIES: 50S ribosomal protein L18 [Pseudomonas]|jgi:large subunit ribosomal protein L18|uniref:Large ribosomal subunit protein uL18 n=3 Tax=Pseudomonas TaxID=286 RepID=A0A2X2CX10_PSELU|nr:MULTISPECIES: 50S ribosomal protein L18 [Pseudomonas]AYN96000.1 50S ribosomal protein L18 [Pseudomonas sp. LTJR-52]ENA32851.1 50S ribosomal protein L18 [Pseudomonas sp. HPB0071]MBA1249178.1 50S ribosomal protein L18 [Pseudomonas zeshuii]MBF8643243.1 50S ribosomal protein L18 [Pseudomonas zeshuii]MBH3441250.1 50S ribosomal protein L18 [Pseudomonas luteola]
MSVKKETRLRRARKARLRMRELETVRLCVYRSSQHIYAQVIAADGSKVLASASTLDKDLREGATSNIEAAQKVGKLVAERAKAAGVTQVAFDRSGFKYHGRVKALADAAREGGLEF